MADHYLKRRRVLITGITGFVGSHLAKRLTDVGAVVYGMSRTTERERVMKGDVLDFPSVDRIMKDRHIGICIHLAGESLVESGQKDPYHTYRVNIQGTLNVLESARKNKIEKVIIASTSHVYGENKPPFREEHLPKPSRPYETSKACVDLIAQSYADTFGLPIAIPRFVNIYGPGDLNFDRLIPRIIKSLLCHTPLKLWGGSAVRDYLYIDDAVSAYVCLAAIDVSQVGKNRIFNFGGGNVISVKKLVDTIACLSGEKLRIEKIESVRKLEISHQYVTWMKAKKVLGWKPAFSLEEGLKSALDWYRKYFTGEEHILKQS